MAFPNVGQGKAASQVGMKRKPLPQMGPQMGPGLSPQGGPLPMMGKRPGGPRAGVGGLRKALLAGLKG